MNRKDLVGKVAAGLEIGVADEADLSAASKALVAQSAPKKIETDAEEMMVTSRVQACVAVRRRIAELFARIKKPMNEAKAAVMEAEHAFDDPLAEIEKRDRRLLSDRLREKQAAEQTRRLEEQARLRREEDDARLREGQRLTEAGAPFLGLQEIGKPSAVPDVKAEKVRVGSGGISGRKTWKAKVIDFAKLDDKFKVANQSMLDGIAKAQKGLYAPEGVEFVEEGSIAVKAASAIPAEAFEE